MPVGRRGILVVTIGSCPLLEREEAHFIQIAEWRRVKVLIWCCLYLALHTSLLSYKARGILIRRPSQIGSPGAASLVRHDNIDRSIFRLGCEEMKEGGELPVCLAISLKSYDSCDVPPEMAGRRSINGWQRAQTTINSHHSTWPT
jgi:hypothetical protein